ncbi:MAG: D-glycero-beta-D-manno-heptose-7-phosphate kinase [Bacteroidota bacterium]
MDQLSVLVAGDYMVDHYYWGSCDRISPEAPVPILAVERETWTLGGAGNVAHNLQSLGLKPLMVGVTGKDEGATRLRQQFQQIQVETAGLYVDEGRVTTLKSRLIAGQQQMMRFDQESTHAISSPLEDAIIEDLDRYLEQVSGVILSDYGKGFLTPRLTQMIIQEAHKQGLPVFVDPKGNNYEKYRGATLLTPNRKEAEAYAGFPLQSELQIEKAARKLREELALEVAVITLSEAGMAVCEEDFHLVPTLAREVYDVTGAGDTSLAAFVYAWLAGRSPVGCAHFANAAAAVVIAKLGSATCTLSEIAQLQAELNR